jgi:anti-anti-sigma regulatory factor
MPAPQPFAVRRHDTATSALVTLIGDIGPDSVPPLRATLEGRLHDGIRTIDIDLVPVTDCGISGLDALLGASQHAAAAGVSLRLHSPPPFLGRLLELTGTGFLLTGLAVGRLRPPALIDPATGYPTGETCVCCEAERLFAASLPQLTSSS